MTSTNTPTEVPAGKRPREAQTVDLGMDDLRAGRRWLPRHQNPIAA